MSRIKFKSQLPKVTAQVPASQKHEYVRSSNPNDEGFDSALYEVVTRSDGSSRTVPKEVAGRSRTEGGWTFYDSSAGHCSLCGKLGCRGSCFR